MKFSGNTAGYGNNIASFPLQLRLLDSANNIIFANNTAELTTIKSGNTIGSVIKAGIFDLYNIIDIQDASYGYINITNNNDALASISKNTVSQPINGILSFDDFIISAPPGSTVEMIITFEEIDQNKLALLGLDPAFAEIIFRIGVDKWNSGEVIIDGVYCELWVKGTYTFQLNANSCKDCIANALWEGGSTIYVFSGYWRAYNDSETLLKWDQYEACLGGYGKGNWSHGYEGNLWRQCVYNEEFQFIRIDQSKWDTCPPRLVRLISIIIGLSFSIIFLLWMIRSFIKNGTTGRNYEPALLRIFLHHFMIIVILKSFDLNWPQQMQYALDTLSFFYSASEMSLSYKCIIHKEVTRIPDVFLKVIAISILPIITIGISWVIWSLCCGSISLNQRLKMQK